MTTPAQQPPIFRTPESGLHARDFAATLALLGTGRQVQVDLEPLNEPIQFPPMDPQRPGRSSFVPGLLSQDRHDVRPLNGGQIIGGHFCLGLKRY